MSKLHIFSEMRRDFARQRAADIGFSNYDKWFSLELNNALLATISTYTQLVPAFHALLMQQGGDLESFFDTVKEISKLTEKERNSTLKAYGDPYLGVARNKILAEPI